MDNLDTRVEACRGVEGGKEFVAKQWRITERDLDILGFLTRYGAATAEQVRREFFESSVKAAYRRLKALEERGTVKGERVFYRMPSVYRVTDAGARLAEVDLPPPRHDLSRLHHTLEVLELSWLVRSGDFPGDPSYGIAIPHLSEGVEKWHTERELRRDKLISRREQETGRMLKKGKMGRIPDGSMTFESGEELAVELELTPKRAANYRRIFSDYEEYIEEGEYDGVVFYFASSKVMKRVEGLAEKHDLDGYLQFASYEPVFERRR